MEYKISEKIKFLVNHGFEKKIENGILSEAEVENGAYVIVRDKDVVSSLNYTAGKIWLNFESPRSIENAIDRISEEFEVSKDIINNDIVDTVNMLVNRGWLVKNGE